MKKIIHLIFTTYQNYPMALNNVFKGNQTQINPLDICYLLIKSTKIIFTHILSKIENSSMVTTCRP